MTWMYLRYQGPHSHPTRAWEESETGPDEWLAMIHRAGIKAELFREHLPKGADVMIVADNPFGGRKIVDLFRQTPEEGL